jgi:hypothetical protein
MNTHTTQHPPSAIEVLSDVLLLDHDDSEQDIAEAIASIWMPIFRTKQSLAMALDALKISHESDTTAALCDRYLDVIRGMK